MKKILALCMAFILCLGCSIILTACEEKEPITAVQLAAPTLSMAVYVEDSTLHGTYLKWGKIENAKNYELQHNGSNKGIINFITEDDYCLIVLPEAGLYDEFRIRAIGDGKSYLTSDWSNNVIVEVV